MEEKKEYSISNYTKGTKKLCNNGCGKEIQWDIDLKYYIEIDTGRKHSCPNWKPKQLQNNSYNNTRNLTSGQVTYLDTIGPAIAEILSLMQEITERLRKLDGFITKF
jgi:hypothetical protein